MRDDEMLRASVMCPHIGQRITYDTKAGLGYEGVNQRNRTAAKQALDAIQ
jgi:hypothetical protein